MKIVDLYTATDPGYVEACHFAERIYAAQLSFTITHFPEYFFVIKDESVIVGCIGLKLTSPLFLNDNRVGRVIRESDPKTLFCEQSIFALDNYSPGVPILISVVTEYAHSLGAAKLAYAGIDVSRRTIAHLGFFVTECGPVDLSTLPSEERGKYELWKKTQNPITCILNTESAPGICLSTFTRHSHRVRKSEALLASLLQNHLRSGYKEAA
jgi:hypothetical protein